MKIPAEAIPKTVREPIDSSNNRVQRVDRPKEVQNDKEHQPEAKNNQLSEEKIIQAIESANKALEIHMTNFEFSIHEETKEIMVKVKDSETGEIIREIPPERVLDAVAKMWKLAGILVDEKV